MPPNNPSSSILDRNDVVIAKSEMKNNMSSDFVCLSRYVTFSIVAPSKLIGFEFVDRKQETMGKKFLSLVRQVIMSNGVQFEKLLHEHKMDVSNDNTSKVEGMFRGIADEVLLGDEKGATWSRIATLYGFSTHMARHCLAKGGSNQFLDKFTLFVGEVIEERAASWVTSQGGWSAVNVGDTSKPISDYLMDAVGVGSAVISTVLTVFTLSNASSALKFLMKS